MLVQVPLWDSSGASTPGVPCTGGSGGTGPRRLVRVLGEQRRGRVRVLDGHRLRHVDAEQVDDRLDGAVDAVHRVLQGERQLGVAVALPVGEEDARHGLDGLDVGRLGRAGADRDRDQRARVLLVLPALLGDGGAVRGEAGLDELVELGQGLGGGAVRRVVDDQVVAVLRRRVERHRDGALPLDLVHEVVANRHEVRRGDLLDAEPDVRVVPVVALREDDDGLELPESLGSLVLHGVRSGGGHFGPPSCQSE